MKSINRAFVVRCLSCLIFALSLVGLDVDPAHAKETKKAQLREILTRLDDLDNAIADVKREVVTCTRAAKGRGECDQVRQTNVSACFALEGAAQVSGEWQAEAKARGEAGVGWTSGPDGKIILNLTAPAGPIPTGAKFEVHGQIAVPVQVCVEIPIEPVVAGNQTANSTRSRLTADADFEEFEAKLTDLAAATLPIVLDRINNSLPSGDVIVSGYDAAQRLGNGDFELRDGLLADSGLVDVVDAMGAPGMLRTALVSPQDLAQYLPSVNGTLSQRLASACDPQTGLLARSPIATGMRSNVCSYLGGVPELDKLPTTEDVVDAITELFNGPGGETAQAAKNRFCSTAVGQRRAFDRVCGR